MIKKFIAQLLPFILILIFSVPTFKTLIRPGYFPMHDDMQAMRLLQMDKCFEDKQIPCRWVPDMGYGYGYPQFIYYSPLPYYFMEFFHLLGFPIFTSVKIVMGLGFILAGFSMFILARSLWGPWGGFLSTILYLYSPYRASDLYSRGAVAEFFAFIFLPLIFWSIYRFIQSQKNQYLIYLSLSFAGLLISHNITTIAFTPIAVVWGLVLLFQNKRFSLLKPLIFSSLLGIGLASFFVIPVILEKQYAHVETMIIGYFNYLAHFVSFNQLFFSSFWGFGSSELGPYDDLTFYIGLFHWLLTLVALILAVRFYKKKRTLSPLIILLAIFFIGASFMTHQKSSFIWKIIPFLKYFQFPWRFLVVATFTSSLAGGAIIAFLNNYPTKVLITSTLTIFIILFNFNFLRPVSWINTTEEEKFSAESWDKQMTISIFDYLPIYAKTPPGKPAPLFPEILEGHASFKNFDKGSNWQKGQVSVQSDLVKIQFPIFDFPGMTAYVNNKKAKISNDNHLGLVTIEVPKGDHEIMVKLKNSWVRSLADFISILSLITLGSWIIYEKNKS